MNTFIWLVVIFAFHEIIFFVDEYCTDGPKFDGVFVNDLQLPSVRDLAENCDKWTIDKYVREVILPAHKYIVLSQIFERDGDAGSDPFIYRLFLEGVSFVLLLRSTLIYIIHVEALNNIAALQVIVGILAPTASCFIVRFFLGRIYKKWFAVKPCKSDEDFLNEVHRRERMSFPVSAERSFKNSVMIYYCCYYIDNEKTFRRRSSLFDFVKAVSAIVYLVFFFGSREPT